ncbi:hypothetical protein NMG60_11008003 [Bertholletia excelsa]
MIISPALRRVRQLSTAAAAAAAAAASTGSSSITISKAKAKLRSEFDPDKALEIYSSVSDHYTSPRSNRYTQDLTIRRLAKSRRFGDIETFLESHKNDPRITQEPFVSTLIRSYGLAGMFVHALRTYNQMDELGAPRSTTSFNALLAACTQSKLFDQRHGFLPDEVSYGMLVKSYCQSGSPELAIETLKLMEEKGVEITRITFTTIVDALYKKGDSHEAERMWNEMLKKGCLPDVAAYNVKLTQAQSVGPEEVKQLIEEMSNAGLKPDTISYNILMTSYCKFGKMDEAKKVYEELEEKGCKPNAATFRTLVYYLCRSGRFERAYEVFKESVRVHKIPDINSLKHLLEGLVKRSKMKEAKGMCRTLRKKFPENILKGWNKLENDLGLVIGASAADETQEAST